MIKAIFATDIQGGMGNVGSLPWPHDKEDLRQFKERTAGHIVVMGSNTWMDPAMQKPLPDRTCVVVTRQDTKMFPEAHEVISGDWLLESLRMLEEHNPHKTVWIIGGAKLLASSRELIQEINLTTFMTGYDCDVIMNMNTYLEGFNKTQESYGRNKIYTVWTRQR